VEHVEEMRKLMMFLVMFETDESRYVQSGQEKPGIC